MPPHDDGMFCHVTVRDVVLFWGSTDTENPFRELGTVLVSSHVSLPHMHTQRLFLFPFLFELFAVNGSVVLVLVLIAVLYQRSQSSNIVNKINCISCEAMRILNSLELTFCRQLSCSFSIDEYSALRLPTCFSSSLLISFIS